MKNVEDIYPLSPLQKSLLQHALAAPHSSVGFEQFSCDIEADLDVEAFRRTWQRLVDRHPILRTLFVYEGLDEPLQVVRQRLEVPFELEDWRRFEPVDQGSRLAAMRQEEREHGLDPRRAPLMRLRLLQLGDASYHFVWSHHHLLLDGWCRHLLLQEAFELYAIEAGGQAERPVSRRPFRDYIAWLQRQEHGEAEAYWRRTLAGVERPTPLPLEGASKRLDTSPIEGETWLSDDLTVAIEAFARRCDLTLNTVVQGAWGLLLSRLTDREDVVFGNAVSGRPAELPGVDSMLGMFINNLPVRLTVPPKALLAPWLTELQQNLAELRRFESTPLEQVHDWCKILGGRRLFDTLVVFQNYSRPTSDSSLAELGIGPLQYRFETAYPLTLEVTPGPRICLRLFADAGRYETVAVGRLLGYLETLLSEFVADAKRRLPEIPWLSAAERQQLREWGHGPTAKTSFAELKATNVDELRRAIATGDAAAPPGVWRRLLDGGWEGESRLIAVVTDEPPARGLTSALLSRVASVRYQGSPELGAMWSCLQIDEVGAWPGPGVHLALLDRHHQPLPAGIAGELWIGSDQLRPIGRRARYLEGGRLEELGELDDETLIHGERVSPGEVEAALRRHPQVRQALAGVKADAVGEPRLVAWVVVSEPDAMREVRAFLERRLPRRSLPSAFVPVDDLPLGDDGGLDRQALNELDAIDGASFIAPRNPTELHLVQIWEDLLELRPIGVRESFFELGGHSLLAVRLAAEVKSRLDRELTLADLAGATTIEELATLLDARRDGGRVSSLVAIQPSGSAPPFFCVHPAGGTVLCYTPLAYALGSEQPFYGIEAIGLREGEEPIDRLDQIAAEYIVAIRSHQQSGPYLLGGWSFGGAVALEMAQQLTANCEEVALLAIFDTYLGDRLDRSPPDDTELLLRLTESQLPFDTAELRRQGGIERQIAYLLTIAQERGLLPADFDTVRAEKIFRIRKASELALRSYYPQPYAGKVTLFIAREREADVVDIVAEDPTLGWGSLAAELEIREVPGTHDDLCEPPHVDGLAAELGSVLEAVRESTRSAAR